MPIFVLTTDVPDDPPPGSVRDITDSVGTAEQNPEQRVLHLRYRVR